MENEEQINQYFKEIKEICDNISREDIDKAIELLFDAWKNENQVFFCGNGGSAGTATHFMCDLFKVTAVKDKKRFKAYCLNDNIPLMTALINDEGFEKIAFIPGFGTTTEPREYSYVDDVSGITANAIGYRLKQIDFNGNFEYSKVVEVNSVMKLSFELDSWDIDLTKE